MKKVISLLLSLMMILSCLSLTAGALSERAGMDALNAQFESGSGASLDYVYYSPVSSRFDKTKYPVVVWLHGNSSGDYPGHQLDNCDIGRWSSDEYQSRFKGTGGAFLFLPRDPTSSLSLAWEGMTTGTLKAVIDAFINTYKDNIDMSRIYIGGYSLGGKMVLRMASSYPEFFAAAFPLSPVYAPTVATLNNLIDMPIWFAWCKNDTYLTLSQFVVTSNWNYLMSVSNCKEECRLVTFDTIYHSNYSVRTADGKNDVHNTWDAATHDFFMDDGRHYLDVTITDGNGNDVILTNPHGLISWLSSQGYGESTDNEGGSLISKLLSRILDFFKNFMVSLITILGDEL